MTYQLNEGVTARLTGVFKDDQGNLLGTSGMTTLKATLYNKKTEAVINGRDEQNVLNANGGTLDSSGNFALTLDPADNPVVEPTTIASELHILLIEWTYEGGAKAGKQEFELAVKNLSKVP